MDYFMNLQMLQLFNVIPQRNAITFSFRWNIILRTVLYGIIKSIQHFAFMGQHKFPNTSDISMDLNENKTVKVAISL